MRTTIMAITTAATLLSWTTAGVAEQAQRQQDQGQQQQRRHGQRDGARGMRMDETIADRVYSRLAERLPAGADVRVQAEGSSVTITGTVPSDEAKRRALRAARRTDGVMEVRDELRVDTSRAATTPNVGDAELAKRVAQKIAGAIPGTKAGEDWWLTGWGVEGPDNRWNVVVEADNGTVWLEGDVPRQSIMRTALEAARQVEGVRSVRNEMDLDIYDAYGPYRRGYDGYPYSWHYPPYAPYADGPWRRAL